jgi:hypothetical protein
VKIAEQIRRTARDLVALYGVVLPETDGEKIVLDRLMKLDEAPFREGFPEVGPDVAVERHLEALESEYMSVGWEDTINDSWCGSIR